MKNVLLQALAGNRAVLAFNFYNLESARAIAAAAREMRRPVILACSESAIKYMGDDFLRFVIRGFEFLVHLDHGRSFEAVKHAVSLGFSSVMIDGSNLPFAENVKLTRRVVGYAHKRGVWVEAELGVLCGQEDDVSAQKCNFTDPIQAKKFVELTGCDSLAIAIGTSHGAYKRPVARAARSKARGKRSAILQFEILKEIRRMLPKTPLVLHGASQIPQKYAKILGLNSASTKLTSIPTRDWNGPRR